MYLDISFKGTANRTAYWLNFLQTIVAGLVLLLIVLFAIIPALAGNYFAAILTVGVVVAATLYLALSNLSYGVRRLNELGNPPWLVVLYFLPFVWVVMIIYLGFMPPKPNPAQ